MNADADRNSQSLWAYLHGELGDEERRAFEGALASDANLCAQFEQARRFDRHLRAASAYLAADGDADAAVEVLAGQTLAAWEREHPFGAAGPRNSARPSRRAAWGGGRSFGLAALAAAALLALAVSPALWTPREARWAAPAFVPLTYRGAESGGAHTLGPADARRCQQALAAALERASAAAGRRLPSRALLALRLHELRGGALSVSVSATLRDGRAAGPWCGDFSSLAAFERQVDCSAAAIAAELGALSGAAGLGGRP